MKIEITKEENAIKFSVDGTEYLLPRKPNIIPSVEDAKEFFDEKAPEISEEVCDYYYHYMWGGMKLRKGNPNPWGWNGGGRRSWRR